MKKVFCLRKDILHRQLHNSIPAPAARETNRVHLTGMKKHIREMALSQVKKYLGPSFEWS